MPHDTAVQTQSDAAAGAAARPAIEFKGLSHPALRAVLNDASADAVRHALIGMLDGDPDRFEWQPVVIDLSRLGADASLDWPELLAALRAVRLHPVAVAGAAEEFRDEANRLQLGWLAPLREPVRRVAAGAAQEPAEGQGGAPGQGGAGRPPQPRRRRRPRPRRKRSRAQHRCPRARWWSTARCARASASMPATPTWWSSARYRRAPR